MKFLRSTSGCRTLHTSPFLIEAKSLFRRLQQLDRLLGRLRPARSHLSRVGERLPQFWGVFGSAVASLGCADLEPSQ